MNSRRRRKLQADIIKDMQKQINEIRGLLISTQALYAKIDAAYNNPFHSMPIPRELYGSTRFI